DFAASVVNKPERHVVRTANMTDEADILICTADSNDLISSRTEASPIVSCVQRIYRVGYSDSFSIAPVDGASSQNFRDAWIIERIEFLVVVADFVHVQHDTTALREPGNNRINKRVTKHRIGITDADNIATAHRYPDIVHHVLVVIAVLRHPKHNPLIEASRALLSQRLCQFFRTTAVILNPDQFVIL